MTTHRCGFHYHRPGGVGEQWGRVKSGTWRRNQINNKAISSLLKYPTKIKGCRKRQKPFENWGGILVSQEQGQAATGHTGRARQGKQKLSPRQPRAGPHSIPENEVLFFFFF